MRILYLTSGLPYPLTSGRLRHYFLVRELARRHEVRLLSLAGGPVGADDLAAVAAHAEVTLVDDSAAGVATAGRRAGPLGRARRRAAAARALGEAAARSRGAGWGDVAVLTGRATAAALEGLAGIPLVVDLCDATSLQLRSRLQIARRRERPGLALRYLKARRVERLLARRAGVVLFASPRDRSAVLGDDDRVTTAIVPNGVDVDYWRRSTDRLGGEVVFTGAMDYPPNIDAAVQLVDKVMPLVWRSLPDGRLRLVGRDPARELVDRASDPRVVVTGFVDDLRPHLEAAGVFLAPLRFGAGIQNKVLEAMSMEVPAIVSPVVVDGLVGEDGAMPPLTVATTAAGFAEQAVAALRAAADGAPVDVRSRAWVTERFSWAGAGARLEAALATAVASSERG